MVIMQTRSAILGSVTIEGTSWVTDPIRPMCGVGAKPRCQIAHKVFNVSARLVTKRSASLYSVGRPFHNALVLLSIHLPANSLSDIPREFVSMIFLSVSELSRHVALLCEYVNDDDTRTFRDQSTTLSHLGEHAVNRKFYRLCSSTKRSQPM